MGRPTFMLVAATDGSPQTPSGHRDLVAYSIATFLMLITLAAAALQFADWLLTPSPCLTSSSQPSASSAPVASTSAHVGASLRGPGQPPAHRYSAEAELAVSSSGCPCP
jgi:hypothetical protein